MDSLNPNEYNPFLNRKKGSTFTQEQVDFIKELLNIGWSPARIAKTYKLDTKSINNRIKNNNWLAGEGIRAAGLSNKELKSMHEDVLSGGLSHEEIAQKYNISLASLERRILNDKWERTPRKNTYTFNEHYFDEIDTETKAYWLGFLYADGYILSERNRPDRERESQSFGFSINIRDVVLMEKFKEDIEATNPIHVYKGNYKTNFNKNTVMVRILLTSNHTVAMLKKWGVVENKTFFITWPDFLRKDLIPHFIRGYSDGDGSIIIDKNGKFSWNIGGTQELLNGIKHYFKKDHLELDKRWRNRDNNNYSLNFFGNRQVPYLLSQIYINDAFCLKRKKDKYLKMLKLNKINRKKKLRRKNMSKDRV